MLTEKNQNTKALINSPQLLLNNIHFEIFAAKTNYAKSNTPDILPVENQVFGKQMEHYFGQYLEVHPNYNIIAKNVAIRENKITLGELDFLVEDLTSKKHLHIEMACKFYVYKPSAKNDTLEGWIGPNGKDSLARKLNHLREKQFPLLHHPACEVVLKKYGLKANKISQQLYMPGLLFLPFGFNYPFNTLNPNALAGYWLSNDQFDQTDFKGASFYLPPKKEWLHTPHAATSWISEKEAKILVKFHLQNHKAPMCWLQQKNGSLERFFVIKD